MSKDQLQPRNIDNEKVKQPRRFNRIFNLKGEFGNGDQIEKESGLFIASRVLEIRDADIETSKTKFAELVEKYDGVLPRQESFPNGLSREQLVRVMSIFELVTRFNGGVPDEHTESRNLSVYAGKTDDEEPLARLSDFEAKLAMTCVEISALGQMVLAPNEDVFYVSGAASFTDEGQFEGHTFQVIKANGTEAFPYAILDLTNPHHGTTEDGQVSLSLFCVPITEDQFTAFKAGEIIEVEYKGKRRKYHYGMGADMPFSQRWNDN